MPASFLHGIETIETSTGPVPITVVKSSVIGLVGSAPLWAAIGAPAMWQPGWVVAAGLQVVDPSGNIHQCSIAGTTGTAAPAWATTLNATTADGTAVWKLVTIAGTLLQTPTLVNFTPNPNIAGSAAAYGPLIQGYTIPYALAAIQAQSAGQAIVVNVFNPYLHYTAITAQAITLPASGPQVLNLGHMGVWNVVVKNSGGSTTYTNGTDYTLDPINGIVTQKAGGAITAGEALSVSFSYADPSKVQDSDVVGTVTGTMYTGIQALRTTCGTMGFFPKILIAPGYSQDPATAAALLSTAETVRAIALIDSPPSISPATAIANRGVAGNVFDTSSDRALLCYPQEKFSDLGLIPTGVTLNSAGTPVQNAANATAVGPYSQWVAGTIAAKDLAQGYWWSPSNTQMTGPLGPDVTLYASVLDAASDVNNLNAQGIVTVFNAFGTGLRVWGNRSAAYPTVTTPNNFISVRRTMDVIEESVELAMLQFIDQPISNALISAILASVNAFIRSLIGRGALVAGSASYNPAENPSNQVAAGQLVFDIDVMPPPPAERLTFNVYIDSTLLSGLGDTNALTAVTLNA
ncbi:MAG TPA: phage tail sheath subtilisin-like domain-containing protein [Candidatus Binataceae bacterium]|jgi:phage tail sheath protein FI|nr:phage tail sheath subtilisin-like domain-containing protein [Candidatus Binataceae bacterium]